MTVFLSNRDGDGRTSEEGHYRLQTRVLKGFSLLADDLKVIANSPANMTVLVSTGDYRLENANGYSYTGWLNSPEPATIPTADLANPRIDSVVLYVDLAADTDPSPPNNPGIAKVKVVSGTPSATPSAPQASVIQASVGNSNPYYVVGTVLVDANAQSIANGKITDTRTPIAINDTVLANSNIQATILPIVYPVGSIYVNATNSANPATYLGFGVWSKYGSGRVLVSHDSTQTEFDTAGETGGAKRHRHAGHDQTEDISMARGSLRTAIGAQASDANRIGYAAVDASMTLGSGAPLNNPARPNGTYSGTWANPSSQRSDWNHFTPVYGVTSEASSMPPYSVVYMWQRIS